MADSLGGHETVLLAVNVLEECVNSGGLLSFFESRREYAPIILPALQAVGATDAEAIVVAAMRIPQVSAFLADEDADWIDDPDGTVAEAMDAADARWQDAGLDLSSRLWAYFRAHPEAFSVFLQSPAASGGTGGILTLIKRWLRFDC